MPVDIKYDPYVTSEYRPVMYWTNLRLVTELKIWFSEKKKKKSGGSLLKKKKKKPEPEAGYLSLV